MSPRPPRFVAALTAAALLVLAALCSNTIYQLIFSRFTLYDDEGTLLIQMRQLLQGQRLYDQVYTQYGPFYFLARGGLFKLLDIPLNHDNTRIVAVVALILSALLGALLAYRFTRSPTLTALGFLQLVFGMTAIVFEPGHPQELCLILLFTATIAAAVKPATRKGAAARALLGFALGALILTKINIGAFLGLAIAILATAGLPASRWRTALLALLALLGAALPALLMRKHLATHWGIDYSASASAAALPCMLLLAKQKLENTWSRTELGAAFTGLILALTSGVLALIILDASLQATIDAVLLEPLRFSDVIQRPPETPDVPPLIFSISSFLLFAARSLTSKISGPRSNATRLLDATAKALFIGLVFNCAQKNVERLIYDALPFLWAVITPAITTRNAPLQQRSAALAITLIALFQGLVAYPVAGSQIQWATVLLIPAALLATRQLYDAARELPISIPTRLLDAPIRTTAETAAIITLAALFFSRDRLHVINEKHDISRIAAVRQAQFPLRLPGAQRIRLRPEDAAEKLWVVANLRSHADTYFSMPGLNSYYFFTPARAPTSQNVGHWMTLFSNQRQSAVVKKLQQQSRLAILIDQRGLEFWDEQQKHRKSPLRQFIDENFTERLRSANMRFLLHNKRNNQPIHQALLAGSLNFNSNDHRYPLPKALLASPKFGLALWFKTTAPGTLLAACSNDPSHKRPPPDRARLLITPDARLRLLAPPIDWTSSTKILATTPRWHLLVWNANGPNSRFLLDGLDLGGTDQLPTPRPGLLFSQLGADITTRQSPPQTPHLQGHIADVRFAQNPYSKQQIQELLDSGPP